MRIEGIAELSHMAFRITIDRVGRYLMGHGT